MGLMPFHTSLSESARCTSFGPELLFSRLFCHSLFAFVSLTHSCALHLIHSASSCFSSSFNGSRQNDTYISISLKFTFAKLLHAGTCWNVHKYPRNTCKYVGKLQRPLAKVVGDPVKSFLQSSVLRNYVYYFSRTSDENSRSRRPHESSVWQTGYNIRFV